MTQFACESVMTVKQASVGDDPAADTCTEGNHYEIVYSACHTVCVLSTCSGIGIICNADMKAGGCLKQFCERYYAGPPFRIACPCEIRGVPYRPVQTVCIRGSYAYSGDSAFAGGIPDQFPYSDGQQFYVVLSVVNQ